MAETDPPGLTFDELEQALAAVDPAALLVPPLLLRRVIKQKCGLPRIGMPVPHRKSFLIDREELLAIAGLEELGKPPGSQLPPTVLLIARPDPGSLAALPRGVALIKYWRLLFHLRVHRALEQRLTEGALTLSDIQDRIKRIGAAEFEEIGLVLRQERFLLPPADPRGIYVEFAAVYLELRYFARSLLAEYFTSIECEPIDAILALDVDAERLYEATRLKGAPDPLSLEEPETLFEGDDVPVVAPALPIPSAANIAELLRQADAAAAKKNIVRAAILRTRAGIPVDLAPLAERLGKALSLRPAETEAWRKLLSALLAPAACGPWPVEARLLYDLQKVCIDHERSVYAVDLVEWALSLGRRPIQRRLEGQEEVLAIKHLLLARRRAPAVQIPAADQRLLAQLLRDAIRQSTDRVRARFRPLLLATLEEVDLRPRNVVERIARQKLVEELLDRIGERGFITMSDLRDALSRNQLKLTELEGPGELLVGDELLLADQRLSVALDGVYRGGEIYLRWLQKLSSLAFGTFTGRFLTRYVALPFGGAFVLLEGLQHLVQPLVKLFESKPDAQAATDAAATIADLKPTETEQAVHSGVHLLNPYSLLLVGCFLLLILHVPAFRQRVAAWTWAVLHGLRWIILDLPFAIFHVPWIERLCASRPFVLCMQWVLKPLTLAAPMSAVFPLAGASERTWLTGGILLYVVTALLINTRLGLYVEERCTDWAGRVWQQVHADIVPSVLRFVMEIFKHLLQGVERLLYTVDEWLRFRSGDSRTSFVIKAFLGVFWFLATYLIRIYINLLVEPTLNPIKHFPVVTVSHKIMLPLIPTLYQLIMLVLAPLGVVVAGTLTSITIFFIPGLFGFMVWEFKENWRLYRANRATTLEPVIIGSHGESLMRLLRPGFHSGTLPKLYAKLRKARRKARRGNWSTYRKHRDGLVHVEESIDHFVERELLLLLEHSKDWGGTHVEIGRVALGTNRIRIDLKMVSFPQPLSIVFTECAGVLSAASLEPSHPDLTDAQRRALRSALAGFYKLSGVESVQGADFKKVTISWQEWVDTWEKDATGRG